MMSDMDKCSKMDSVIIPSESRVLTVDTERFRLVTMKGRNLQRLFPASDGGIQLPFGWCMPCVHPASCVSFLRKFFHELPKLFR